VQGLEKKGPRQNNFLGPERIRSELKRSGINLSEKVKRKKGD